MFSVVVFERVFKLCTKCLTKILLQLCFVMHFPVFAPETCCHSQCRGGQVVMVLSSALLNGSSTKHLNHAHYSYLKNPNCHRGKAACLCIKNNIYVFKEVRDAAPKVGQKMLLFQDYGRVWAKGLLCLCHIVTWMSKIIYKVYFQRLSCASADFLCPRCRVICFWTHILIFNHPEIKSTFNPVLALLNFFSHPVIAAYFLCDLQPSQYFPFSNQDIPADIDVI